MISVANISNLPPDQKVEKLSLYRQTKSISNSRLPAKNPQIQICLNPPIIVCYCCSGAEEQYIPTSSSSEQPRPFLAGLQQYIQSFQQISALRTKGKLHLYIQDDQINMYVCFRYLVKRDSSGIRYCTVNVQQRNFLQGTRTIRPFLSGQVVG